MPFEWVTKPNPPSTDLPVPVPPGEITYEVKVVANSVDYGGTVRYNTANRSYDIVYEFPTLNVVQGVFENGIFESANIGNAYINMATINQASINTANITNATIQFGYTTGDPTANSGIANKHYVDNAVAAISSGSGPDNTANLFLATGDLLVGFAPNTAHRLGVGTQGQVLTVKTSSSVRQTWLDAAGSQRAVGIFIGTHHHPTKKLTQVLLTHADGMIMNDGEYVRGWDNLIADIATTGAGGLDSNSARAVDTWYEVWAIRNSTTGSKALLLHRMLDRFTDQQWPAPQVSLVFLRRGDTALTIPAMRYCTKVTQSFVPSQTLKLATIDLGLLKVATPTGNLWLTVQGDDGIGNADGSVLCTSERLAVQTLTGSTTKFRFVFDEGATLQADGRYHIVAEGDWPYQQSDTDANGIGFIGNTAPLGPGQQVWMANVGYTRGNLTINSGYGDCRIWNVVTSTWKVSANATGVGFGPSDLYFKVNMEENNTSLVLPSGYNQRCLISYVATNGSNNFKEYHQHNRTLSMGFELDWKTYAEGTVQGIQILDLAALPPTPVTMRLLCTNQTVSLSGLVSLGTRFSVDLFAFSSTDVSARGIFTFTTGANRLGYTAFMTQDGWNYMYTYDVGSGPVVGAALYVSGFSF